MAETIFNHECIICGTKYKACNNCIKISDLQEYESYNGNFNLDEYCKRNNISQEEKQKLFFGYKSVCDTFDCYIVFYIIRKIKANQITKEQAKLELKQLGFGLDEIKNFKESVRDFLLDYFGDFDSIQESPVAIEEVFMALDAHEEEPIIEDEEIQPEEIELEEIPIQEETNQSYSRRRNQN